MKQNRKLWTGLGIVAGLIVVIVIARVATSHKGQQVDVAKVQARTIRSSILASASLSISTPSN